MMALKCDSRIIWKVKRNWKVKRGKLVASLNRNWDGVDHIQSPDTVDVQSSFHFAIIY